MTVATTVPTITIAGQPLAPCDVALPLRIIVGRSGATTQPDPPTARFRWLGEQPPFAANDPVTITLNTGYTRTAMWGDSQARWADPNFTWSGQATPHTRFAGEVESLVAVEKEGVVKVWEVGCVGTTARLGRFKIETSRPAETDVARVTAIAATAGRTIGILGEDRMLLEPDDIDRDALSALWEVASWTGAIVWEDRTGALFYGTADHRQTGVRASLPACILIDGLEWEQDVSQIVNHVTVEHGPDDNRVSNTYADGPSITARGYRHVDAPTLLTDTIQANALAATILLRRSRPWWAAPGALIHSDKCTPPEWWAVNRINVGDGVGLPIPPEPGAVPADPYAWTVEGWQETWEEKDRQRLQLALTDRARWGGAALRTWAQVRDQGSWADWVEGSWLDMLDGTELAS